MLCLFKMKIEIESEAESREENIDKPERWKRGREAADRGGVAADKGKERKKQSLGEWTRGKQRHPTVEKWLSCEQQLQKPV